MISDHPGWHCSVATGHAPPITAFDDCEITETFANGQTIDTNEFGNWKEATKSGTKFHDLNADGVRQGNEPGLGGWQIYVDENNDGNFDAGEPTATTSSAQATLGQYTITGIKPSDATRKVREVPQAGWICSYPNASTPASTGGVDAIDHAGNCFNSEVFLSGDNKTGNDFGNYQNATKSGHKYEDQNADGSLSASDKQHPLSGWTIYIDANDNNSLDQGETQTTTDANGAFSFPGLKPGTYTFREVISDHPSWHCSFATGATINSFDDCEITETFSSGQTIDTNEFGNWKEATKSGHKYEDQNADGSLSASDKQHPLSGWTIYIDANNNNSLDQGETQTTTDANGAFSFPGLKPGTYTFREVISDHAGWHCSFATGATINSFDDCEITETFSSGQTIDTNEFGNWKEATKSGHKYEDQNADGSLSASDKQHPLSGWTIYIDANNNNSLDQGETQTTTDANGAFSFPGLKPGTYTFREVISDHPSWHCSFATGATINSFDDCEITETFSSGQTIDTNEFGNWKEATKSGHKYEDQNADGSLSASDKQHPLSGWTIYIDANNNNSLDQGETQTTTDANGAFSFPGLKPGTYTFREVISDHPAGTARSPPEPRSTRSTTARSPRPSARAKRSTPTSSATGRKPPRPVTNTRTKTPTAPSRPPTSSTR